MSKQTFALPDVGEGLTEAEVVTWQVAVGDTVAVNDVLLEIETAKSLVELPSPFAGTVTEILVPEGQTALVGTDLIVITAQVDADTEAPAAPEAPAAEAAPAAEEEASGSVLVGYGAASQVKSRRRKAVPVPVSQSVGVLAKPPIRKLARDLGVNLDEVTPSGASGEVTRQDVVSHAEQQQVFRNLKTPQLPEVREERIPVVLAGPASDREEAIPVRGVRKAVASGMVRSAYTSPHVSVWTDVDATRTMELVKRLKASPDFADIKISPLLIFARAVIWAVRRTPMVNAAWVETESGAEIRVRNYVNLGIAAATPRGLLVPNIKDAQDLSMRELAAALQKLTLTAREGKTTPADQQDGTITITNIGVFGMDAGTPIINPGEAGIVAMGTIRQKPWVVDGQVVPRWVTTVSGSFDHRVIDGDKMSRFIADIAAILEEPALLLD